MVERICINELHIVMCVNRGSKSCRLHVMTPNRPLVFTGNDSLVFAPYHTHYPQLEAHMRQAGLQPSPNKWDQPLHVGTDNDGTMDANGM